MNGADILCDSLLDSGVDVCFSNPGTSEMHFVAALDRKPQMRCVLGLFEGVVTGAADGYARMAGKPAATLLHLGPGLANGLANLHNAKRARSPMVNIIGDHASYHLQYDAPLTSDIEHIATPMSDWVHTIKSADDIAVATRRACAVANSESGKIATLILPADTAWSQPSTQRLLGSDTNQIATTAIAAADSDALAEAASRLLSGEPTLILLGGDALVGDALTLAGRIAQHTGAGLLMATSNKRVERGRGRTSLARLPYPVDAACEALRPYRNILLIGARSPVAFFAYPDKPSLLAPDSARIVHVIHEDQDILAGLEDLAERVGARASAPLPSAGKVDLGSYFSDGKLTGGAVSAIVAHFLPEHAIVCDESITGGNAFLSLSQNSAPHDYLQLTGGAIGIGLPLATGAAIACPDRKVVCLEGDGSGMYTIQALWTQARESLNCLTIIFANRSYAILQGEMDKVGAAQSAGQASSQMLRIDGPSLDWVKLAKGMGVEAYRVETVKDFMTVIQRGLSCDGPMLIEAVI